MRNIFRVVIRQWIMDNTDTNSGHEIPNICEWMQ
jgi:hypothetical protein